MSRRRNDREIEIDKVYSKSAPANVFHGLFSELSLFVLLVSLTYYIQHQS